MNNRTMKVKYGDDECITEDIDITSGNIELGRVVSICVGDDGYLEITENCDSYFSVKLDVTSTQYLGDFLLNCTKQMKDNK